MNLRIARQIAKLTQRQLADRAGVDMTTISLIETNKRPYSGVGYATVVKLARALGVEPDLLFPVLDRPRPAKTKRKPDRSASVV